MESTATIKVGTKTYVGQLSHLQAAEIAASAYGFFDLDVEPNVGFVKITAYAKNRKVSAKGATMQEAVEKLIGVFTE